MEELSVHPLSRTICEHERVRLPGNWSGLAMTGCAGGELGADPDRPWPSVDQWRDWLLALVRDPSAVPGYSVLKHSGKGEVFRARFDLPDREISVVCKRTLLRGMGRRVLQVFGKPKARLQFDRALGLLRARVRTPLPLAYVVRGRAKGEAWSVTEFVEGAADLDHIALSLLAVTPPNEQRFVRDGIVEALGELFDHLEMNSIFHRDLKASNIVLTDWNKGQQDARVWLIDLEGVRLGAATDEAQQWRAIVRLTASLMHYRSITRTDFVRFLQSVLSSWGSSPTLWREHFHRVAVAARQYLTESKRRKRGKLDGYVDGV